MFIFLGTRNGKEMVLVVERDEEVHFIKVQIMEQHGALEKSTWNRTDYPGCRI